MRAYLLVCGRECVTLAFCLLVGVCVCQKTFQHRKLTTVWFNFLAPPAFVLLAAEAVPAPRPSNLRLSSSCATCRIDMQVLKPSLFREAVNPARQEASMSRLKPSWSTWKIRTGGSCSVHFRGSHKRCSKGRKRKRLFGEAGDLSLERGCVKHVPGNS